jgi:hypothetical protein
MDVDDLMVRLGVDAKPKVKIDLGVNTEAGFTGHEVDYRWPGGFHTIDLWVAKDVLELDAKVHNGFFEPIIPRKAVRVGAPRKLRFKNLFHILIDCFKDMLQEGIILPGEAIFYLMGEDEDA